ncbi:hypothetical protein BDV95DRAFT_625398 [Massariosphaeria phaeospora]|uniref:Condensation domain-containing protein n=1 Tax=Massariosphaeria phaeospora TaxID=100035 RepID=A0A7C8MUU1_9PLEO|nr:hypothetical protein BDV95DRAFT_625398 [Massariosphaeria phaeospora]
MAPWQPTLASTYSRPLGENETFIKMVGDAGHPVAREHWAINSIATIVPKGGLAGTIAAQLRRAWGHLRFLHPSIAAFPEGENLIYHVPGPHELQQWIENSFKVVDDAESAADVVRTLPVRPQPSATITFITKTAELLGHTAHWRTNGIGVVMLFDALLRLVTQPDLGDPATLSWGEEVSRLAPAVEDAASIPDSPSATQKALGQTCVETFGLTSGAVGIPFLQGTVPQGTLSAAVRLSPALTKGVVQAAKKRDISVTSAVHASLAFANWQHAAVDRKSQHYTSTVRFSLRPGLYTTGWMERVEATESWEIIAKHYNEIYQRGLRKDFINGHREYAKGLSEMLHNLPEDLPPASDIDISSIGIAESLIERIYGSDEWGIEVDSVEVSVEILTPQATCFVWTFRDQLNLTVVYNEVFHAQAQMQDFVESIKSILLEELRVEESLSSHVS